MMIPGRVNVAGNLTHTHTHTRETHGNLPGDVSLIISHMIGNPNRYHIAGTPLFDPPLSLYSDFQGDRPDLAVGVRQR